MSNEVDTTTKEFIDEIFDTFDEALGRIEYLKGEASKRGATKELKVAVVGVSDLVHKSAEEAQLTAEDAVKLRLLRNLTEVLVLGLDLDEQETKEIE